MIGWLVLVTALWAAPAPLASAEEAMAKADFHGALAALDAAENEGRAEVDRLALLRAECHLALAQKGPADLVLTQALRRNPALNPGPDEASPALLQALAKLRQKMSGELAVSSAAPGARVLVDGAEVGPPPLRIRTLLGRHRVEVRLPGGASSSREVIVPEGGRVSVTLEPAISTGEPSRLFWVPAAVGVGAGGVAAVLLLESKDRADRLSSPRRLETMRPEQLRDDGKQLQAIGLISLGVGTAAFGLASLLYLGGGPRVAVQVAPGGAAVVLGGELP